MAKSLIGTTYDLLAYHRSGNSELLKRSFDKAASHLKIETSDENSKKLRNWTVQFLRTTGFIDIEPLQRKWSLSPPALIETSNEIFVFLGSSSHKEALRKVAPVTSIKERPGTHKEKGFPEGVTLFPSTLTIALDRKKAVTIADELGVHIVLDYQSDLFTYFPSFESVWSGVSVRMNEQPLFPPDTASYFNMTVNEWYPVKSMYPEEAGLYRCEPQYAATRFYVATKADDHSLEVFQIVDREWVLACFCFLFGYKIGLQYNKQRESLLVQKSRFEDLRLPTLMERCFRSGSMTQPILEPFGFRYETIRLANLRKLITKMPIFTVEQK